MTLWLGFCVDDDVHEAETDDDDEAEADWLGEGELVEEPLDEAVGLLVEVFVVDNVDIGVLLFEGVLVGEILVLSVCDGVAERVPLACCVGETVQIWDVLLVCDTLVVCDALVDKGWLAEVDIV